jgi:hypothetical protein
MPHEVVIRPRASSNAYGEGVSGPERRVAALVEPARAVQRGTNTEDLSLSTTVVVDDIDVEPEDRIVMPTGEERIIRSVARYDFDIDMMHSVLVVE